MYKIAICDDEEKILDELSEKIKIKFQEMEIEAEYFLFSDSKKLLEHIEKETIDVLFLDIDMPHFTGMDIGKVMIDRGYKTRLVFVTSHDALVYQTFAYRPFGFIRKTYFDEEIRDVVSRLSKELVEAKKEIIIKKGNEIIKLLLRDICYIESQGNYLNIYSVNGCERHRETMGNLDADLKGKGFIRCHKGYLVNSRYIEKVHGNELELSGGEVVPIGRSYDKDVKRMILELMRNR